MALAKIATHKQAIIDVDGHKMVALAFNSHLNTVPLVFIHGFGASVNFWNGWQTEYIQQHCKWYSLSLPGHYPATFPPGFDDDEINADRLAEITIRAVKKLVGEQRVILIGHSTGGFTALNVAIRAPQMVQAVASVAGFVQGKWTGSLGMAQQWARWGAVGSTLWQANEWLACTSRAYFDFGYRSFMADDAAVYVMPGIEDIMAASYIDFKARNTSALFTWLQGVQDIDIRAGLSTISVPALVMAGEDDPLVPSQQARIIREGTSNSEYVGYPGAGHMMMWERHEQYHRDLTAWLQKVM